MVRPGELEPDDRGPGHQPLRGLDRRRPPMLHGVQLWVALPDGARVTRPRLRALRAARGATATGWRARVFLGSLLGSTSPVTTPPPLLGAELVLEPGARCGSTSTRRSSTASWSTLASSRVGDPTSAARPGVRRARTALPRPSPPATGRRPAAAARRPAVRRADRHVVELRRPHPRRDRRLPPSGRPRSPRRSSAEQLAARRPGRFGLSSTTTCPDPGARDAERAAQGTSVSGPVVGDDGLARCPWGAGARSTGTTTTRSGAGRSVASRRTSNGSRSRHSSPGCRG